VEVDEPDPENALEPEDPPEAEVEPPIVPDPDIEPDPETPDPDADALPPSDIQQHIAWFAEADVHGL